jgi:hypothetical protein
MVRPKVSAAGGARLFAELPAQSQDGYRARVPILVPAVRGSIGIPGRLHQSRRRKIFQRFSGVDEGVSARAAARSGRVLFAAAACCSISVFKTNHRLWKTLTGVQFRTHVMEPGVLVLPGRAPTELPARRSSAAHNDGLSSRRRPSWGRHFVRIRQNEHWPQHSQSGRRCRACVCRAGLASQYCSAIKID